MTTYEKSTCLFSFPFSELLWFITYPGPVIIALFNYFLSFFNLIFEKCQLKFLTGKGSLFHLACLFRATLLLDFGKLFVRHAYSLRHASNVHESILILNICIKCSEQKTVFQKDG